MKHQSLLFLFRVFPQPVFHFYSNRQNLLHLKSHLNVILILINSLNHLLYPVIFLRKSYLFFLSSSSSTPLGEYPSTTPIIPLPCSVSATITCNGLAVAAKILTISCTFIS